MKFIFRSLSALVALAAAASAFAQGTQTIPTPASSAAQGGRAVVAITPMKPQDVIDVMKGSGLLGGGGATLLPHQIPAGTWVNGASFPLQLVARAGRGQTGRQIIVNGMVADSGGSIHAAQSLLATVPPGATFSLNLPATVTALANNVSWLQTGIVFGVGSWYSAVATPQPASVRAVQICTFNGGTRYVIAQGSPCRSGSPARSGSRGPDRPAVIANVAVLGYYSGASYVAFPTVVAHTTTAQLTPAAFSLDVNQGLSLCAGSLLSGNNIGQTSTAWTTSFPAVAGSCTVANVQAIHTCGFIGCDAPPPWDGGF